MKISSRLRWTVYPKFVSPADTRRSDQARFGWVKRSDSGRSTTLRCALTYRSPDFATVPRKRYCSDCLHLHRHPPLHL